MLPPPTFFAEVHLKTAGANQLSKTIRENIEFLEEDFTKKGPSEVKILVEKAEEFRKRQRLDQEGEGIDSLSDESALQIIGEVTSQLSNMGRPDEDQATTANSTSKSENNMEDEEPDEL